MDKREWFELVEQAEELRIALLSGDPQSVTDQAINLINLINMKVSDEMEMVMNLECLQCGHKFEGSISYDELGWHSACPECEGSFDVDVLTLSE